LPELEIFTPVVGRFGYFLTGRSVAVDTARSVENETQNAEWWGNFSQLQIQIKQKSQFEFVLRDTSEFKSNQNLNSTLYCEIPRNSIFSILTSWLKSPQHFRLPFNSAFRVSSSTERAVSTVDHDQPRNLRENIVDIDGRSRSTYGRMRSISTVDYDQPEENYSHRRKKMACRVFFKKKCQNRPLTYGPRNVSDTHPRSQWSHEWWGMVQTLNPNIDTYPPIYRPIDVSRSISTVDHDQPTGEYGRYRRSITIYLRRITVERRSSIKYRDHFAVDLIDDGVYVFQLNKIWNWDHKRISVPSPNLKGPYNWSQNREKWW